MSNGPLAFVRTVLPFQKLFSLLRLVRADQLMRFSFTRFAGTATASIVAASEAAGVKLTRCWCVEEVTAGGEASVDCSPACAGLSERRRGALGHGLSRFFVGMSASGRRSAGRRMSVSPDTIASFADGGVFVDPFGGIDYAPQSSRHHTALSPLCPRLSLIPIYIYN